MDLMTTREVAKKLRLKSVSTVCRWVSCGKLPRPVIDEPNLWRFSVAQIDEWLEDRVNPSHKQEGVNSDQSNNA